MTHLDPLLRTFTDVLLPDSPTPVKRRQGTVSAVHAGPPRTVDVTIGGLIVPGISYLGSYVPTVNDVVFVDFNGPDPLVIGAPAPQGAAYSVVTSATRPSSPFVGQVIWETDNVTFSVWDGTEWRRSASVPSGTTLRGSFGAGGNTSSASYVDMPGPIDITFTKRADASALNVLMILSAYVGAIAAVKVGFSISGVDYDCCNYFFNVGSDHRTLGGLQKLAGIPKTATSLRLRWAVSASTVFVNNDDYYNVQVMEMR